MSENQSNNSEIRWTASEYVEHEKGSFWYAGLVLVAGTISVVAYFLTQEWITPVSIGLVVIGLGVFASIKPNEKEYIIDTHGISIGKDDFLYTNFRSFSVVLESNYETLYLKPNKRFAVPLTLYFPPERGEVIVEFIGNFVPYEEADLSGVDKMMSRLKF